MPAEGMVDIPILEKEVESHQSHYKVSLLKNLSLSCLF